jgi:signal transduction histidine kinase
VRQTDVSVVTESHEPRKRSRTTGAVAAVAVLLLMASAVTFARSDQTLRVSGDAAVVREAERAIAAGATYRANLTIAVVAAASEPDSDVALRAVVAAGRALDRITSAVNTLGNPGLIALIESVAEVHDDVVGELRLGDVTATDRVVSAETLPLLDDLQIELGRLSREASNRIDAEAASAGQATRISSFVVALLAPALGFWAFRRAARRRLENDRLAGELARQRELSKVQEDLIAGLSHQLRTPLTGIYGFAQALLDEGADGRPDPALVTEASRTILGEANRLRGMVDDILVTARSHTGPLAFESTPYDLCAEVTAAVEPFVLTDEPIEVACEPVTVTGDRFRLRHVIRNLTDNALRHGAGPVRIVGVFADGYRLIVEDAGEGPPDDVELFRPFAHSGEAALVTGSLGLGLGVCRALCDGMNVGLAFERDTGVTRFVVTWPADAIAPVPAPSEDVRA